MTCHVLITTCPVCGAKSSGFACTARKGVARKIEKRWVCTKCKRLTVEAEGWTVEQSLALRGHRKEAGLTLGQLSRLTGISVPDLSAFERATKAPTEGDKKEINAVFFPEPKKVKERSQ